MSVYADLQLLEDPWLKTVGAEVYVLRLDQLPIQWSGNKFFKLKYNIAEAKRRCCQQLISFGGAYSNHIHALALAGREHDLPTVGIIRGEETSPLNDTLQDAVAAGMVLNYVSRAEYRRRYDTDYLSQLQARYPNGFIIPEGGSNILGVKGCTEIIDHIRYHLGDQFDAIIAALGTGATLAGVIASAVDKAVLGVPVLKNAAFLEADIRRYLVQLGVEGGNWSLYHDFHCGGYAKISAELASFIQQFMRVNGIPVEPVYTGKMFFALYQLLQQGKLRGKKIVAIHTGGLQGFRGMEQQYQRLLAV